mgnify:CR=1 FL=1
MFDVLLDHITSQTDQNLFQVISRKNHKIPPATELRYELSVMELRISFFASWNIMLKATYIDTVPVNCY